MLQESWWQRQRPGVIIDHQGIGLEVLVPDSLLSKMPVAGSQVKIYTYFSVREDAMQLFGFADTGGQRPV